MVPAPGERVEGVLYLDLPESAWPRLDAFEGDEYNREQVEVRTADGRSLAAWTYVFKPEFASRLGPASGISSASSPPARPASPPSSWASTNPPAHEKRRPQGRRTVEPGLTQPRKRRTPNQPRPLSIRARVPGSGTLPPPGLVGSTTGRTRC
jgi:hypothetical protein